MRTFCNIIACVLALSCVCSAVDVSARSAVLYEPETGTVLYAKDADTARQIASTTKIMTAVVVLENADISEIVTVPKQCTGIEGTSMYLKENEKLSVSDLLYGLMLQSGNDAAITLAHHVGNGKVEKFVEMMNDTARKIGMKNTNFKNPNGLTEEGHCSTAYDMALLSAYAMKIPKFAEIVSTKSKSVAGRALSNHNKLLRMYDGAEGIKTGFTKAAGRCLVSSATRGNMRLIAVTLNAPDDWDDHIGLFDFGFASYSLAEKSGRGTEVACISVVGGEEDTLSAITAGDVCVLLRREEAERLEKHIKLPRFIYAPVERGQVIGEIDYVLDGKVIDTASVVSNSEIGVKEKEGFFNKILNFLRGN